MPRGRSHRSAGLMAMTALVLAVAAPVAFAGFSSQIATGPLPVTSATLADPTSLTATNNVAVCQKGNKAWSLEVDLLWAASTSTYASGYLVYRKNNSTGVTAQVATVTPVTATGWNDTTRQLSYGTSYTYTVQTYVQSWTSPGAAVTITTLSSKCA